MILLDTHVWIWYVQDEERLPKQHRKLIERHVTSGLGVSSFSFWEVAKSAKLGRLALPVPVRDWLEMASTYPGIVILPITPGIATESADLPGLFHRDPADQIIVATARVYEIELLTFDAKILNYEHVKLAKP